MSDLFPRKNAKKLMEKKITIFFCETLLPDGTNYSGVSWFIINFSLCNSCSKLSWFNLPPKNSVFIFSKIFIFYFKLYRYKCLLTYWKGSRSSQASIVINVIDGDPPKVNVLGKRDKNKKNPTEAVKIVGEVETPANKEANCRWENVCKSGD